MAHPFGGARCSSTSAFAPLFLCHMLRGWPRRTTSCRLPPTPALGRVALARHTCHHGISSVGYRCAPTRGLSPCWHVFCRPRPRRRFRRILPYALPGSDPPAGTARRSIELEESAILRDLLQPGRVAHCTSRAGGPRAVGRMLTRPVPRASPSASPHPSPRYRSPNGGRSDERARLGTPTRPDHHHSGRRPAFPSSRFNCRRSDATGQVQRAMPHPLARRIASSRSFSSMTTSATGRLFR